MINEIALILTWVTAPVGLVCFWLCIKHPWGWFIGVSQQVLYVAYGFITLNYGFVFWGFVITVVFFRNYYADTCTNRKAHVNGNSKQQSACRSA
jgi:hypothetical protein